MKANELMIGDWVNETYEAVDGNMYEQEKQVGIHDFNDAKNFEPIPITPEILEKNGFEYDEEGRVLTDNLVFWINDFRYIEYNPFNKAFLILGVSSTFDGTCIYVHELQHALRLCKIDKEVKL